MFMNDILLKLFRKLARSATARQRGLLGRPESAAEEELPETCRTCSGWNLFWLLLDVPNGTVYI